MKNISVKKVALTLALLFSCNNPPPTTTPVVDAAPVLQEAPTEPIVRRPVRPESPASPDTRSAAQIAQAACTAADGTWRCASKKPVTFAVTGSTPIIPVSWTVPNWFVNKLTGNDLNNCTTSGTACATKQEILVHRWGCVGAPADCPRLQQTTTIEQDASDTDNTDPLYVHAAAEKGSNGLIVQGGTPTIVTSTTLGAATTARNRTVGANALLLSQFTSGAPSVGQMVQNTTVGKTSRAYVYRANGGNWDMTNPSTLAVIPPTAYTQVNTWANTDTVNLLSLVAINVADASCISGDENGTSNAAFYFYQATLFDPLGNGADSVNLQNAVIVESVTQRLLIANQMSFGTFPLTMTMNNVFDRGGVYGSGPVEILGGADKSSLGIVLGAPDNIVDGDLVVGGALGANNTTIVGSIFLDVGFTINAQTLIAGFFTTPVWWGDGANTVNVQFSSHLKNGTGSNFQTVFTAPGLVTGIKINGTTSVSCHTNADPDVFHTATTTPAHLDAACGAGTGLGSNGFQIGGASVANF